MGFGIMGLDRGSVSGLVGFFVGFFIDASLRVFELYVCVFVRIYWF